MDLAKRMAEGITAKLDFDFACNRGYSFGEYHLYGIVNEILSANIDQSNSKIQSGYSPAVLARPGRGRNPEIDFAVLSRKNNSVEVAAEVKWAASSHCNVENVLNDLLRL